MTDLTKLIADLEAAEGPSRKLDVRIWEQINNDVVPAILPPTYTASVDAALTLVPEGAEWELHTLHSQAWCNVGLNFDPGPIFAKRDDGHMALALCIAALKARAA